VDSIARAYDETVGRWVVRNANAVVGVSDAATAFAARLGAKAPTTVPNWLPFASAEAVRRRLAPLRAEGFPSDARLVFVSRMVGNKGIWELLDAFSQVVHDRPGLRLRMVGDGPEREPLARRARELGLPGFQVLGRLSEEDRLQELALADLSMQPSRGEGFGLSLMEAVAEGIPVVASRCDAYLELLDGGRLGLMHDVGDADGLAKALRATLADPAGSADRAQKAHRELAARHGEEHARACWRRVLEGIGVASPGPPQGKRK
jgi:glycosyltransferase involved in cell wall biosynthesis